MRADRGFAARWGAPVRKLDAFRDGWFAFDMVLVILMWFETWLLSLIQLVSGDISSSSSCLSLGSCLVKELAF